MTFYCSVILPRGQTFTLCQHTINGLISFGGFFLCCSLNNLFLCLLCFHVRHRFLFLFSGLITTTQHELIMFQLAFRDWFCFAWNKPHEHCFVYLWNMHGHKVLLFCLFQGQLHFKWVSFVIFNISLFLFVKHYDFCQWPLLALMPHSKKGLCLNPLCVEIAFISGRYSSSHSPQICTRLG